MQYNDADNLKRGQKFRHEGRVYTAHSADSFGGRVYIETTTETLLTMPYGVTVEAA